MTIKWLVNKFGLFNGFRFWLASEILGNNLSLMDNLEIEVKDDFKIDSHLTWVNNCKFKAVDKFS